MDVFPLLILDLLILSNKYKVKKYSILVSKLNPRIPRIWAIGDVDDEKSICSTEFQVLLPINEFLYSFALNLFSQQIIIEIMKSRASGTSGSHQRIAPQDILGIEIVIPDIQTIKNYAKIVGGFYPYINNNIYQSNILAKVRESLLPKLMNGEIPV